MIQIPADRLSNRAQAIFQFGGSSGVEANQVAKRLIEANLFGHNSHGVGMMPDALIDSQGNSTTDPGVMYTEPKGALCTMGSHKGYGLAVICETLVGQPRIR